MDDDVIMAYIRIRYGVSIQPFLTDSIRNIIVMYLKEEMNVSQLEKLLYIFPEYAKDVNRARVANGFDPAPESKLIEDFVMEIEEEYFDESVGDFEYDY